MVSERKPRLSPAQFLLVLVALLYPVNYSLALKLRIADILILLLVFASLPYLRVRDLDVFVLIIAFFAFYTASTLYGILAFGVVTPTNFLFVYKYIIAFVLIWVISSIPLEPQRLQSLQKVSFLVFYLLVAWVFVYVLLRARGVLRGSIRVSFPFSNALDPGLSDAPLYSVVLSTCLIAYLFTPRGESAGTIIKAFIVAGVTGLAIMLSGSRTGLVSVSLTFFIWCLRWVYRAAHSGRIRFKGYALWIALLMIVAVAVIGARVSGISNTDVLWLFSRAVSFGGDESVDSRLGKALYAIQVVFGGPVLLGIGSQSTFHTWFDGTLPNVLVNAGAAGVALFLLVLYFFLRHARARARLQGTMGSYNALEYLFINYFICSISTESFLVTRGLVPFAVFAAIFLRRIYLGAEAATAQGAAEITGGFSLTYNTGLGVSGRRGRC